MLPASMTMSGLNGQRGERGQVIDVVLARGDVTGFGEGRPAGALLLVDERLVGGAADGQDVPGLGRVLDG